MLGNASFHLIQMSLFDVGTTSLWWNKSLETISSDGWLNHFYKFNFSMIWTQERIFNTSLPSLKKTPQQRVFVHV